MPDRRVGLTVRITKNKGRDYTTSQQICATLQMAKEKPPFPDIFLYRISTKVVL